uniref:Uncharacterized protein n=1 Tax=Anguilla anguilla TaxID=7936 RepID=A0A0E9W3N4_ANGAN
MKESRDCLIFLVLQDLAQQGQSADFPQSGGNATEAGLTPGTSKSKLGCDISSAVAPSAEGK